MGAGFCPMGPPSPQPHPQMSDREKVPKGGVGAPGRRKTAGGPSVGLCLLGSAFFLGSGIEVVADQSQGAAFYNYELFQIVKGCRESITHTQKLTTKL